jgi:NAD(P)-dependent dehydrogenase (short-subunit alcohol dehydrogenase family)
VIPISLISGDLENNRQAAKLVQEKVGKLDMVIANAGMCFASSTMMNVPVR